MKKYSVSEVSQMHYSQLVGLFRERNRPSGGIKSVQIVAANSFLNEKSRVLEIGSNTGFTSVNLALLCGCSVVGIDVNPPSVAEASEYSRLNGVERLVSFQVESALNLPFKDNEFNLVWASNVTSFIEDKLGAIGEYLRVLKHSGYLAFVPIYYRLDPPSDLVERVGKAINTSLRIWKRADWLDLCFSASEKLEIPLELVFEADFEYLDRSREVDAYCEAMVRKPHLNGMTDEVKLAAINRYSEQMRLFNENLQYCGFSVFLFQKRKIKDEAELFLSRRVNNV